MSINNSQICEAINNNGNSCRNRTRRGHYCWQHLRRDQQLRIKTSNIPNAGLGLFTTEDIKRNQRITEYLGEDLTRSEVERRYPGKAALYVYCKSKNICRDARDSNSSEARFANDGRTDYTNNTYLRPRSYILRAKKNIKKGDEILWSYGDEY